MLTPAIRATLYSPKVSIIALGTRAQSTEPSRESRLKVSTRRRLSMPKAVQQCGDRLRHILDRLHAVDRSDQTPRLVVRKQGRRLRLVGEQPRAHGLWIVILAPGELGTAAHVAYTRDLGG